MYWWKNYILLCNERSQFCIQCFFVLEDYYHYFCKIDPRNSAFLSDKSKLLEGRYFKLRYLPNYLKAFFVVVWNSKVRKWFRYWCYIWIFNLIFTIIFYLMCYWTSKNSSYCDDLLVSAVKYKKRYVTVAWIADQCQTPILILYSHLVSKILQVTLLPLVRWNCHLWLNNIISTTLTKIM